MVPQQRDNAEPGGRPDEVVAGSSGWLLPDDHVAGLLAGVFHSAPSGVAVVDRAGQLLAANAALAEMTGWDLPAMLGRPWRALLHRDDWTIDTELAGQVQHAVEPLPPVEARLVRPDGVPVWVLLSVALVHDEQGRLRFTDSDGRAIYFLRLVTDISEQKRVEAELAVRAGQDPLTGLANRSLLLGHLAQTVRRLGREHGTVAVLFCDLDRFKVVNDSLGHAAGDSLLCVVAERLEAAFRSGDLVARLGGDEFVVAVTIHNDGRGPVREVVAAADRIHDALRTPIAVQGRDLVTTASIGIALTRDPHTHPDVLLRDADAAMYVAKRRGGDRYELFDETLRTEVVDRLDLEHDLRDAINRGELDVAYQPIIRLYDGAVVAAEALVRWHHAHRGLLLPDQFIPLAEETGLVRPLDQLVLQRACTQAAGWHMQLGDAAPAVRVNLSAREFTDPDLTQHVTACLRSTGLPARQLCFEITETALITDPDAAATALAHLRSHGVRFAVDDFGTGYASLSYLTQFPLDMIKIDRSFVHAVATDAHHAAVVAAIIGLARALDLTVTAEGVETTEQRDTLYRLGCRNGQGNLWAEPGDAQQMQRLLAAGHVR